jgi:Fe-S-cluster containining protein
MTTPDDQLVRSWLAAATDPDTATALEAIYARASAEISRRGPTCWTSGKCCNFTAYGHRLYTTGLEAAYTLTRLPPPPSPLSSFGDKGEGRGEGSAPTALSNTPQPEPPRPKATSAAAKPPPLLPLLTPAQSLDACPFQVDKLCTVHAIRPMGCRVYFCDKTAQHWQHELSEQLMGEIRALHDARAIDYRYAEWRYLLDLVTPYLPTR